MRYYFQLQYQRAKRKLLELGFNPNLGIILAGVVFLGVSKLLFYKLEMAAWIYTGYAIFMLLRLGESSRNERLQLIFQHKDYVRIRVLENAMLVLPFVFYLLYEGSYWVALAMMLMAALLATVNFKQSYNFTIPTPFKKFPFEFLIGFRKTLPLLILAHFLLFQAVRVNNFNLGIFSLGFLFLLQLSYYFKPEQEYFAWIFSANSKVFLSKKIIFGWICSTILTLPILIVLLSYFTDYAAVILGIQFLGYFFLMSMILAKYAAFPQELSLKQSLLYGLSLSFPPLFLFVIPFFYRQAKKNLKPYLE